MVCPLPGTRSIRSRISSRIDLAAERTFFECQPLAGMVTCFRAPCATITTSSACPRDAGADEIKRAHRQLTRRYHPDISGDDLSVSVADASPTKSIVDFPSVLIVLDRMRHSFFGASRRADRAPDVVVTPQEAFWGATVPARACRAADLRACGGRGEVWNDWCAECGGAGDLPAPADRRAARFRPASRTARASASA